MYKFACLTYVYGRCMQLSEHQCVCVCVCKRDKFLRNRVFDNNEVYNHLSKV